MRSPFPFSAPPSKIEVWIVLGGLAIFAAASTANGTKNFSVPRKRGEVASSVYGSVFEAFGSFDVQV